MSIKYKLYQTAILQTISHRLLRDFVNNFVSEFGISIAAWSILDMLADKRFMTFNEIAMILGVDAPFVTELINELTSQRLIDISKSPDDKRVKVASLTIDGLRMSKKIGTSLTRNLTKFLDGCTSEDVETYFKVLQVMIKNSQQMAAEAAGKKA